MKIKNKTIRAYLCILALTSLVAIALRTSAIYKDFDFRSGHFDGKSLITAASIIITLTCVTMVTYLFFSDKSKGYIATFSTPMTYVPAGTCAAALVFFLLKVNEKAVPISEITKATPVTAILLTCVFYLSFPAIIYFILNSVNIERASVARAITGIASAVCFALYTSYLYFDTTLTINSPNKIIDEMAFLIAALFFLYETRISISRESWNIYFVIGAISSCIGFYSSIPSILAYATRSMAVSESLEENILMLTVSTFIFARLILLATYTEDKRSETVTLLRDAALERESFICEREEIERQKSIEALAEEEAVFNDDLLTEEGREDSSENNDRVSSEENKTIEKTDGGEDDSAIAEADKGEEVESDLQGIEERSEERLNAYESDITKDTQPSRDEATSEETTTIIIESAEHPEEEESGEKETEI